MELRAAIGNRIYGCDDCQLACPWNKFAKRSALPDFDVRDALGGQTLLALWAWSEEEFLARTEGSPIRRIGYTRWQRNLAVGLGNALRVTPDAVFSQAIASALRARLEGIDEMVAEHIRWALAQAASAPAQQATTS